jgi:hypothetical protein
MTSREHVLKIVDEVPDEFWAAVGAARQSADRFRTQLKALDKDALAQFCWTWEELANQLSSECQARTGLPKRSEDTLDDLANWAVALGEDRYRELLEHPERLPRSRENPGFVDEIIDEYEARFGEELPQNTRAWDTEWRAHGRSGPWFQG